MELIPELAARVMLGVVLQLGFCAQMEKIILDFDEEWMRQERF